VGAKVPGSESSTPGTFAPGSEWSWERKVHNSGARPHGAVFEVMTIDANAFSMRGKVLFYVKINVQLYDLYHTWKFKTFMWHILAIICEIYMA